jgi:hypothetical protein
MDLSIKQINTEKDKVKQPPLAKHKLGIIPKFNSSLLLIGKSGSGKSTLLANLVSDKRFYGDKCFDLTFLISPTGEADDIQKSIKIPPNQVFTDIMGDGIPALAAIQAHQEKDIKENGAAKAKRILIIFDDVIGNEKFMREPAFVKSFIACRHYNCTTILCSQHFTRVPRVCRLQANYCAFFAVSNSEAELLAEEHGPPQMHKKQFLKMIDDTLKDPYSFLGINLKQPWETRFRKNLNEVINLDYYRQL